MRKHRFSAQFRARLSDKLMDLGNIAAAGLVFGPFISEKVFSPAAFISGIILAVICYVASYITSS